MAYEEKSKTPAAKAHSVSLEDRARLNVTGVEDVESFDETVIVMNTTQGDLIVRGSGLHISKINLDVGQLSVEGVVSELSYEEKRDSVGFWQRLFG